MSIISSHYGTDMMTERDRINSINYAGFLLGEQ